MRETSIVSEVEANAVWDILVAECGASEFWRSDFVYHATTDNGYGGITEYRFQGDMGFGGKVWHESHGYIHERLGWTKISWDVNYYMDDYSVEREQMMKMANERLKVLEETLDTPSGK